MSEIRTIQGFLGEVRGELAGKDPALIQDALYDVDEFLRGEQSASPSVNEADLVERAVQKFGSPSEIAEAYSEMEQNVQRAMRAAPPTVGSTLFERIFGVFADPHAYGALFFVGTVGFCVNVLSWGWLASIPAAGLVAYGGGRAIFTGYLADPIEAKKPLKARPKV